MFLALLKTIADEMTLDEINEEIDRLIGHRRLVWLLGAGASFASGLPLMDGLTARVVDKLRADKHTIKDVAGVEINTADFVHDVLCTIGGSCTVEQVLDHLADYLGMARRVAAKTVRTPLGEIRYDPIERSRLAILHVIRETIRYGYRHDTDPTKQHIGSPGSPIVDVRHHVKFVEALFGEVLAARFAASPVDIFTTNYDTLIEDALSLCSVPYADGFSGGAVAFWNPSAYLAKEMIRSRVYKLHGSVDWTATPANRTIVRRRIGDAYPEDAEDLLIYPQASKYDLARREPFDTLFQCFRDSIGGREGRVLVVCGYGFGDEHINHDIQAAMGRDGSDLTLLAFAKSPAGPLSGWLTQSFGERIYVLAEDGVYRATDPACRSGTAGPRDWWTFEGMTARLRNARTTIGARA